MFNKITQILTGTFVGAEIENGVFKYSKQPKEAKRTKLVFKDKNEAEYNQMMKDINDYMEAAKNTIKKALNPPHQYKSEKWFKNLIEAYNKNMVGPDEKPLKFFSLTEKEKEMRKKQLSAAQDAFAERSALNVVVASLLNSNKKQIMKNIGWEAETIDFDRNTAILLSLFTKTPEDAITNIRVLSEGTKQERQAFFNSRMKAVVSFAKEYLTAKDTSEYIDKMNEVLPFFIMLGEIDGDKIDKLAKRFGVDYPDDIKKDIDAIGINGSSLCSTYVIGNAINPYYPIVSEKNTYSIKVAYGQLDNIPGYENEFNDLADPCGDYEEFKAGTAGLVNPVAQYVLNYADTIAAASVWLKDELKYYLSIKPELEIKSENNEAYDLNDDESLDKFIEDLSNGKRFMSYYKDGTMNAYISLSPEANPHLNIHDYKNGINFLLPNESKKVIDEKMYDLDHWYNWKNSKEFKDVLTTVKALKSQIDKNPGSISNQVSAAKKAAEAYLKSKYPTTKTKNDRTYAREEFCAELISSCDKFLKINPRFKEVDKPVDEKAKDVNMNKALEAIIKNNKETGYANNKAAEEFAEKSFENNKITKVEININAEEKKTDIVDNNIDNQEKEIEEALNN